MNPITAFLTFACGAVGLALGAAGQPFWGLAFVIAAVFIAFALKMANAWQKFVILRAGKLHREGSGQTRMAIPRTMKTQDRAVQFILKGAMSQGPIIC